jgi:cysteine-rich CPCC protein
LDSWVVNVAGEDREVAGRWLLAAIADLLALPHGAKDDWVYEAIRELSGYETAWGWRYPCPCCDFLTLDEPPTGTFQICAVCGWEEDNVQYEDPDYEGGANRIGLLEARKNITWVRPPYPEEAPP